MEVSFDCESGVVRAHAETEEFALSFCARTEPAGIYGVHKYYLLLHSCVSSSAGEDARIRLYIHRSAAAFYGTYIVLAPGEIGRLIKLRFAPPDNMADQFESARRRFISAIQ